jgi:hypothetical protein
VLGDVKLAEAADIEAAGRVRDGVLAVTLIKLEHTVIAVVVDRRDQGPDGGRRRDSWARGARVPRNLR